MFGFDFDQLKAESLKASYPVFYLLIPSSDEIGVTEVTAVKLDFDGECSISELASYWVSSHDCECGTLVVVHNDQLIPIVSYLNR